MRNQLYDVYRNMLGNGQVPVQPAMQRRIVDFARSLGDSSLLVALLGRLDVDKDVERELSMSDDLEVLAAWASDPRRTSEDLRKRLEGEKRVGALMPLARRAGLPPEVYETIAARRSVRLAEALADNVSVPDDVRAGCLRFLAARPTWGTASTPHELSRWMRSEADVRAVVEVAVHLPHLRVAVESPYFTASLAETAAARLRGVLEDDGQDYSYSWSVYPVMAVLSALRKFQLSEEARRSCLAVVDLLDKAAGTRGSGYYGGRPPSTDRLREAFDPEIEGFDVFLRRLSDPDSDVVEMAGKVFSAADDDAERRLGLEALVSRQGVPDELLRRHFSVNGSLTSNAVGSLFVNLLSEGRVPLLAELSQGLYGVDAKTATLVQQHPLGRDLVQHVSARCREGSVPLPGWVRELLRHDQFADLALEVAQWPELSELLSRSYAGHSALSARVQEILLDELGDDVDRWRVFSELAGSFAGSLRMLLQTVKVLA